MPACCRGRCIVGAGWFLMCAASAADTPLRHNYYALRHGQSLANVEGVISSDPAVACNHHGLSETGLQQARRAAEAVCAEALSTGVDGVAIVSSDFKRAWQTAQAVHTAVIARGLSCVPASAVCAETLLRERSFGTLSGGPDSRYADVWVHDAVSATHTEFGSEPVTSVRERAWGVVERLEAELPGRCMVVLVAHGDVLQILQTRFACVDPRTHRSLPHLETATLRRLSLPLAAGAG